MSYNSQILKNSQKYLGIKEIPGAENNSIIVGWLKLVGLENASDETAWCSAFINGVLAECGLLGTGKATARSFLHWGLSVKDDAVPGDIVVLERGSEAWQGHVGIFMQYSKTGSSVLVRGGNQGNTVSEVWFDTTKIIDVRRYQGEMAA